MVFDWSTSRQLCQDLFPLGSDIASFETEDEWTFLSSSNFARLGVPLRYSRIWVGLSRPENTADAWSWVAHESETRGYVPPLNHTRWAPGEPSNGYEEQCTQIILTAKGHEDSSHVGRWADEACYTRAPVICEAKMPNYDNDKRKKREAEVEEEPSTYSTSK